MMGATVFKSAAVTTTGNSCGRGEKGHSETKMPTLSLYSPTGSGIETKRRMGNIKEQGGSEVIR